MTGLLTTGNVHHTTENIEGMIEFLSYISEVVCEGHGILEKEYGLDDLNRCGIWAYEVPEELGSKLALYIQAGNPYESFDWRYEFAVLNEAFFSKDLRAGIE